MASKMLILVRDCCMVSAGSVAAIVGRGSGMSSFSRMTLGGVRVMVLPCMALISLLHCEASTLRKPDWNATEVLSGHCKVMAVSL